MAAQDAQVQEVREVWQEYGQLVTQRSWWDALYRELSDYFQPWRSRFLSSEANKPKRNSKNARNKALLSIRIARAGLMAGLTPQARPWFDLITPDPDLNDFEPVKEWRYAVQQILFSTFARSNIYDALHESYGDDVTFGISSLYIEDDPMDLIRAYVAPVGSFACANSERLEVETHFRRTTMTPLQLRSRFGEDNLSDSVKGMLSSRNYYAPIEVIHAIRPRRNAEYGDASSKGMPWQSCWFESGGVVSGGSAQSMNQGGPQKFLSESGYQEFPVMVSRWEKTGEDVYGRPPSIDALGAAKGLQKFEERRLQALDKLVNPPMNAPTTLRDAGGVTTVPGDTNYYDPTGPQSKVEPSVIVDPRIFIEAREELHDIEDQIEDALFVKLFKAFLELDRSGVTAEEIRATQEEKLLQIGPMVERMQREKLAPAIRRSIGISMRRGELPPPPEELRRVPLAVDFIAPLAAAQRAVATQSLERTAAFTINLAKFDSTAMDYFDTGEAIRTFAKGVGVAPKVIRDEKTVQKIRADREKADQAAQMAAMAKPAKDAATAMKVASEAKPTQGSVLANIAAAASARGPAPPTAPPSALLPPGLSVVPGGNA